MNRLNSRLDRLERRAASLEAGLKDLSLRLDRLSNLVQRLELCGIDLAKTSARLEKIAQRLQPENDYQALLRQIQRFHSDERLDRLSSVVEIVKKTLRTSDLEKEAEKPEKMNLWRQEN